MEYSPKKIQLLLEKHGFNLKKNFGQNFIVDENIIRAIMNKAGIDKNTLVLEIGPGAGFLTYYLGLEAKQVLCYEIDTSLKSVLEETLHELDNVRVIYEDFLKANVLDDLQDYEYDQLYVVANLPYYITTPIIMKIIEEGIPVQKLVIMVQKEVGDRFKAVPGTKDYNSLSVYLHYYFDVKKILDISRNVFLPKPNVDSIVLELVRKQTSYEIQNESLFFDLVRNSFKQKRKTLRNNLNGLYHLELIESVLKKYHLDLSVRAEQLPIEIFVEMANVLDGHEDSKPHERR